MSVSSRCVPSDHYWLRADMASSGFCLLNTVAVAAVPSVPLLSRLSHFLIPPPPFLLARPMLATTIAFSLLTRGTGTAALPYLPLLPFPLREDILLNLALSGLLSLTSISTTVLSPSLPSLPVSIAEPPVTLSPHVSLICSIGNGTEEIVRNLSPHEIHLPLPSSWAPISQLSYKPWLNDTDSRDVFFSSIHLFAEDRFYPCSGGPGTSTTAPLGPASGCSPRCSNGPSTGDSSGGFSVPKILNLPLTPLGPGPWDVKGRKKLSAKQRQVYCQQASQEMRSLVTTQLLPALEEFQSDLIFLSTGLDSHVDDLYHFLSEEDLHWLTNQILSHAALPRHTRVISILEGGYSLGENNATTTATAGTEAHNSSPTHQGSAETQQQQGKQQTTKPASGPAGGAVGRYGIRVGDGGLVKGTLAHVTALAGR
jgi:hypothetical protein